MKLKNKTLVLLIVLFSCTPAINNNTTTEKKVKINYLKQSEFDKILKDRNTVRLSRKDSDFLINKFKGISEIEIPEFKLSEKTDTFSTKGSWMATTNGYRCYCYRDWANNVDIFNCPESPCSDTYPDGSPAVIPDNPVVDGNTYYPYGKSNSYHTLSVTEPEVDCKK